MKRFSILALLAVVSSLLTSCVTDDPYVNRSRSGGALLGGAAGAIIGHNTDLGGWEGAAVGAVIGGILGDAAGRSDSVYYNRPQYRPYPSRPQYRPYPSRPYPNRPLPNRPYNIPHSWRR